MHFRKRGNSLEIRNKKEIKRHVRLESTSAREMSVSSGGPQPEFVTSHVQKLENKLHIRNSHIKLQRLK